MKQTFDAKSPDVLAQITEIMQKHGVSFGTQSTPVAQPAQPQAVSFSAVIEAMNVANQAQTRAISAETRLEFNEKELLAKAEEVKGLTERLAAVMNSFEEAKKEQIQVIASKADYEVKLAAAEAKAIEEKELADAALKALKEEVEQLKAAFETKQKEAEEAEKRAVELGAELAGAKKTPQGQPADTETLSAEEAADRIAGTEKTEQEKLEAKYIELEGLAFGRRSNEDVLAYQEFVKQHGSKLGVPIL